MGKRTSMIHLNPMIEFADQQCKAQGTRLTPKRKLLLKGLIQANKALSAYELIDYCKTHFNESIPAMSAYRILEFLEHNQLVHKLHLANKYIVCAHMSCNHSHGVSQFLICKQCALVKEISLQQPLLDELAHTAKAAGFDQINQQLEIASLCNLCAQPKTI